MKKLVFPLLLLLAFANTNAQIIKPVKWTSKVDKISDTEFNLVMQGKIDADWHLYSQFTPQADMGSALPSEFTFDDAKGNYELVGKVKESPYTKKFSEAFQIDEYFFENKVTFTQKVKIVNPKLAFIKGKIDYQVCKTSCINDDYTFKFELPNKVQPVEQPAAEVLIKDTASVTAVAVNDTPKAEMTEAPPVPIKKKDKNKDLWTIFILSFLGGLTALLMPCIFPMIPMTVSFFTKQSKSKAAGIRNAIIYGLSIIAIYVILGSIITGIFGAGALNELSTSIWFNIGFFVLLIVFALSFLGAFEIVLPSSWATKIDAQADRGGVIGIIFMALALAIVSFSCTGPIVGNLLVVASRDGGIAPIVGMLGFSLAVALPFMLFAMFPGWLNSMPKSGGWLNTVKVSLGFLELAFAFKFLSNADLVLQKHWLHRELFIAIWIAVFAAWAMYLFGKYMLPHDYEKAEKLGVGRLMMAILVTAFTLYMVPGLWGAPLKILSGLTPPINYAESTTGFGATSGEKSDLPEHAHFGPHGIIAFEDYDIGLAYAKKENKPVLIDFTGDACANCRKMEDNVWSDPEVLKILKEKVVLISLYCDRKIELPKEKQYVSKSTGKEIQTIGNKWTDFQITRYGSNSQPLYVVLDNNGKDLSDSPMAAEYDIQVYKKWLEDGIAKFK